MRSATRNGTDKDPEYLNFIRSLRCVVCVLEGSRQHHATEAAHIGERGLSQKCSDREAIPLCAAHHRLGADALHRLGKGFWSHHNIDGNSLLVELRKRFETKDEH